MRIGSQSAVARVFACSLAAAAVAVLLTACAPFEGADAWLKGEPYEQDPADPFESTNREIYKFNDALDKAVVKRVARAYNDIAPKLARSCVTNFFSNLKEPTRFVSHAIRREGGDMIDSTVRFFSNTLFGVGGCFEVAESMHVPMKDTDIGLALLSLDFVEQSPYIVLPVFGPSTVISAAGYGVSSAYLDLRKFPPDPDNLPPPEDRNIFESQFGGSNPYATDSTVRLGNYEMLEGIDFRARLLGESEVFDAAALDPYLFLRDSYLQHRSFRAEELARQ